MSYGVFRRYFRQPPRPVDRALGILTVGDGTTIISRDANASGTSTVTGYSEAVKKTDFTVAGTSNVTGYSEAVKIVEFTVASTSAVSGVGQTTYGGGEGTITGTSNVNGESAIVFATTYTVAGSATIITYTEAVKSVLASADGSASLASAGATIWNAEFTFIAEATTSADSGLIQATEFDITASAVVTSATNTVLATTADAAGTATVPTLNSYHFNASDWGPSDPNSNWFNEANAFDGIEGTVAVASPYTSTGVLSAGGTVSPTSGGPISLVRGRIRFGFTGYNEVFHWEFWSSGKVEKLGERTETTNPGYLGWSPYVTLTVPSGGWTWQKVNDLECYANRVSGNDQIRLATLEVEVTSEEPPSFDTSVIAQTDFSVAGTSTVSANSGSIAKAELLLLATDTALFDGSVSVSDPGNRWTNESNAVDGSLSTYASSTISSDNANSLQLQGHTLQDDGSNIYKVVKRVYCSLTTQTAGQQVRAAFYSNATGVVPTTYTFPSLSEVHNPVWQTQTLPVNYNYNNWTALNSFECKLYAYDDVGLLDEFRVYRVELEVTHNKGGFAVVEGESSTIVATEATIAGTSTVSANSEALKKTEFTVAGTSDVTGVTDNTSPTDFTVSGTSTVSANSEAVKKTEFTIAGTSTVSGVGEAIYAGATFTVAGTSNVTTNSAAIKNTEFTINIAEGSITADSTEIKADSTLYTADQDEGVIVRGYSEALKKTDFSVTGTSTVSANSEALKKTEFTVAGTSDVTGVTDNTSPTDFTVSGTSTVSANSEAVKKTEFTVTGTSNVTGVTNNTSPTDFTVAGTSTVSANSEAVKKTEFTVTGTSNVTGEGAVATSSTEFTVTSTSNVNGYTANITTAEFTIAGTSAVSTNSEAVKKTEFTVAGTSNVTSYTSTLTTTEFDVISTSNVSGYTANISTSEFTIVGISTVSTNSEALKKTEFTVAGTSNVTGVTDNASLVDFTVAGTSTVLANSEALKKTEFTVAGTSNNLAYTQSVTTTSATIGGTSTVTGLSQSITKSEYTVTGSSIVTGYTESVVQRNANATGIAAITGLSRSTAQTTFTISGISVVSGVTPAQYELEGYRFRYDDGTEITATWRDSQDAEIFEAKGINVRLRTLISVSGDPGAKQVTLQYRKVGESDNDWRDV